MAISNDQLRQQIAELQRQQEFLAGELAKNNDSADYYDLQPGQNPLVQEIENLKEEVVEVVDQSTNNNDGLLSDLLSASETNDNNEMNFPGWTNAAKADVAYALGMSKLPEPTPASQNNDDEDEDDEQQNSMSSSLGA